MNGLLKKSCPVLMEKKMEKVTLKERWCIHECTEHIIHTPSSQHFRNKLNDAPTNTFIQLKHCCGQVTLHSVPISMKVMRNLVLFLHLVKVKFVCVILFLLLLLRFRTIFNLACFCRFFSTSAVSPFPSSSSCFKSRLKMKHRFRLICCYCSYVLRFHSIIYFLFLRFDRFFVSFSFFTSVEIFLAINNTSVSK